MALERLAGLPPRGRRPSDTTFIDFEVSRKTQPIDDCGRLKFRRAAADIFSRLPEQ